MVLCYALGTSVRGSNMPQDDVLALELIPSYLAGASLLHLDDPQQPSLTTKPCCICRWQRLVEVKERLTPIGQDAMGEDRRGKGRGGSDKEAPEL
ncbi:hypothetical protein MRX96_055239 [Rhipicephalus microplus]